MSPHKKWRCDPFGARAQAPKVKVQNEIILLTQLISEAKMKKIFRNRQGKGNLSLPMVMNANCEVVMYKQLYVKQSVNAQIYKRLIKLEELGGDYYYDLLEWISDYIFLHDWEDDKLEAKIEEFRAYRHKAYEKLEIEQQKLRKLEVNMNGRKKVVDVMSLEVM